MKSWFRKVKERGFFSSFSNDTKQDVDNVIAQVHSPSSGGSKQTNHNYEEHIKIYDTVEETIQAELEQWLSSFDNRQQQDNNNTNRRSSASTSTTPTVFEHNFFEGNGANNDDEPFTPTTPITPISALTFSIAKKHVKISMALVFFNSDAKSIVMELNGCLFEIHYTDDYSPVAKNDLVRN